MFHFALLTHLQGMLPSFLHDLETLSQMDCGTFNKIGVNRVGRFMRKKLEDIGLKVETYNEDTLGDSLIARLRGNGRTRLLLLGHLDTVYPEGWCKEHPFFVEGDIAHGPGTADMKAGLLVGVYTLAALRAIGFSEFAEIAFVLNSDEEISSPTSRWLIEREALKCDAALVLEAGRENGDIVSARKGLARFDLHIRGRAAHAGTEPERGRSAILELAHQIITLHALNERIPQATVTVGVVAGGTASNTVAAEASAQIDIRAVDHTSLTAMIAALHECATQTIVPETTVTLVGGIVRPPMEKTVATEQLAKWYQEVAQQIGISLQDVRTGGVSDANITSTIEAPTLDGLGPVGGLDHSPDEYILISSIVPRMILLAELIRVICTHSVEKRGEVRHDE